MSIVNKDTGPPKRRSVSRKTSSIHQISKKGAASKDEDRSLPNNTQQKRSSISHNNLMGTQGSVHSNQKNKQTNAQNSQQYFKNYDLINEKSNQQNGNTAKVLETATGHQDQMAQKKNVYSLDSSTMKKGRSDQDDSKDQTHMSFAEKFQNKQLNLKLPDYAPENHGNYSGGPRSNNMNMLQVGRMYQEETSPEDNQNSATNQDNEDSVIKPPLQDFTDAFINHKQVFEQEEQSYCQLSKKNPNLVFDLDHNLNHTLNKYLSNQKELIQRDGNIKINGILIKGAPSLGTKFHPNFRDPYHAPCIRPQSRGLTQGSILQIATKALAHIQSQSHSRSQRGGIRIRIPNHSSSQEYTKRDNMGSSMHKRTTSHGFSQGRRFIGVRGTKKQTIEKKAPQKQQKNKNKDIAKSLKSLSSQNTKGDQIVTEKVKIQGGGQDGQDKVQLNVKFKRKKQDAKVQTVQSNADGYEDTANLNESINSPMRPYNGSSRPNNNKSYGRLNADHGTAIDSQSGAHHLIKSESSQKMIISNQTAYMIQSAANVQQVSSKNLDSCSVSKMDRFLDKHQITSYNRQSSGSFGMKMITRDASKFQETKSINIKRSRGLDANDSDSDIRNVKNLRINIQNLNETQQSHAQHQTMPNHPKSVKEMQQYRPKNITQNMRPEKRAKTQENNSRAYRMKRIKQGLQQRQMRSRPNNFSSTVQSSVQGNSQIQSATNTHVTQSLRKGKPINDFMKQMQKFERNENLTPQFFSNTYSMNQSPVNDRTLNINEKTASGANTGGQSAFNSGIYLHGSNIPDLNSMDSLPTRPQLSKHATGHTSAQLYGKPSHQKSRSKPTFQNVAPKVQSRNFNKANATIEAVSHQTGQAMTSQEDKFKTEKMDLTLSQQNTLRQEQNQLQKDKPLHSDRFTKVTNNTMQLQNDQTFSGHGSFELNQTNKPNTIVQENSPKPQMEYNIQSINIGGPDEPNPNNLIVVSNDEQNHERRQASQQIHITNDADQNNIKRIILRQNQLSEPKSGNGQLQLHENNNQQVSESFLQVNSPKVQTSLQSPSNQKLRYKEVLKATKMASYQNSPSLPGVTEYLNDSEFVDMFMKPKGIEIFNPDLLSSDKASRQQNKNYINFQNYQSAQKMRSTTQKPLDPSENEHQSSIFTQSHMIDSSIKQSRQIPEDNHLVMQNSLNNTKMVQMVQQDQNSFKRFKTVNQKKRPTKQIRQNETIDIDEMHYTEISSNANSMDKSAILQQQKFTTQKTQKTQIPDLDANSLKIVDKKKIEKIPLSNQDLKARQKQIQEQCATELSCDPHTVINDNPNKKDLNKDHTDSEASMTEMAEKDLKISEKKFTDSVEKFEDGSQIPKDDNKHLQEKSNNLTLQMSQPKSPQTQHQSQLNKRVEIFKDTRNFSKLKSRLSYQKEDLTLSMDGRRLKELNRSAEKQKQRVSSIATPNSKDEDTVKKNSKAFSAMVSENLLDIHDLGQNYLQIDEMFSNSQDLADQPASSLKKGLLALPDYLESKSNRYRPIHQINVQMLTSTSNDGKSSNPLHKSSCYEMRNSKQRDVGIQLSWQNSHMNQDKQSNCKSDATARQNESYQKDLSQLVGGPKFSPPNSGFSKTTINQASIKMINREITEQINIPLVTTMNLAKKSQTQQNSERQSTQLEIDFLDSMAKIQRNNNISMNKMKKFVDDIKRKQLLFEMLYAQRRKLFKSPNQNDQTKILIGNGVEIEADVLLNGNIHMSAHKKRESDLGISLEDEKQMLKNQLMRQRCFSDTKKQFMLKGQCIDASSDKVKKAYEYVHKQALRNFALGPRKSSKGKSPKTRIYDSRILLQRQLKNLPLTQLQKIHEILTAGGIIVQQENLNQKSTNSPCYQNLIESQNDSYIKIKFKQDGGSPSALNKSSFKAGSLNQKESIQQPSRESKQKQKLAIKRLNISEIPLNFKINKDAASQEMKSTSKQSEEEIIRDAIVNKILSEEKMTQSIMVAGEEAKDQKMKQSVNLYQEGLSIIEDIQANITETITDNDNQFIQYQEVGSINNMFNSKFDHSRDATARQLAQIKMNTGEESSSPQHNLTQSIHTPGSIGCIMNEYSIPNAKEESTIDYRDKKTSDVKKSHSTLDRVMNPESNKLAKQNTEESPANLPSQFKNKNKVVPFEDYSAKLRNRNLSVLSKQKQDNRLNFMDEDQTDNQTIYLGQRAGSNANCIPGNPSALASHQQKHIKQMKAATSKQSKNNMNEVYPMQAKQRQRDKNYNNNYATTPVKDSPTRKATQQPLSNQGEIQYQSFGRIVPTITIEGSKSQVDKNLTQADKNIVVQQQQIKNGGGKSSLTRLVDHDNENQSPKTYTDISYNMEDNDGNFSDKNTKPLGTSMQGSEKDQKLVLSTFSQKQVKCETNRQTKEMIVNNSSTINDKIVNRSKNSVTYKRLNEDLDIDLQRANIDIEYEDMLDSSLKDKPETQSTQVKNKRFLNTGGPTQQDTQQFVANENYTLGSQKYSNTVLADLNSPQTFNPTIYDMQHYSLEGRKSFDDYVEAPQNDKSKRNESTSQKRSRNQQNEYNKIQKLTAEIQISRRTHFNHSNGTQIERSDNSFVNTELINQTILTQTLNTKKGVPCAKYLQSTCQLRPKSQGIMGSQKMGKKILHQNLANYELYMQLKQMKNVGKQIGVLVQGDNNSSEPTIRDQGTLTHPQSNPTEDNFTQQLYRKESSKPIKSEADNTKGSSHLFTQVSQKMKEVFSNKTPQLSQTIDHGLSRAESKGKPLQSTKERIQKYHINSAHHRRFNTLSVEFQKQQNERLRKQTMRNRQRRPHDLNRTLQQSRHQVSHGLYSPKVIARPPVDQRPFSSNMFDNPSRSNDEKPKPYRNKMEDNSLYQQFFDPACRLINQQRFLNKINQQHQKDKERKAKITLQINATQSTENNEPKLNVLKVVTPNFYERQNDKIHQFEFNESELMLQ